MNQQGQFLLYDAILALIIVFIVMMSVIYVLEQNNEFIDNSNQYEEATDVLDMLDSYIINNESLLEKLSYELDNNDSKSLNETLTIINNITALDGYAYAFIDTTKNRTVLINTSTNNPKEVYSGEKTVNNHVFELDYYKKY